MKQVIADYTVRANGNHSLITIHHNEELIKGMHVNPSNLEEKFKEVCKSVEKHVSKSK